MSVVTIETPFNIDLEFKTAAFPKRLAAWLIDLLIIIFYFYLMYSFLFPLFQESLVLGKVAEILILDIPVFVYQLVSELFFDGQTLGKRLMSIKVIDKEGKQPSFGQYIIRWMLCLGNLFIYFIPILVSEMVYGNALQNVIIMIVLLVLYLPDFLSVVISAKSQRIGDFAANTLVIDKNYQTDIHETIYQEIENKDYKPQFPQVMRLTDRDINGIRNLLNVKRGPRDTEHYIVDVAQKIKKILSVESDLHPTDFLEQLLRDYNYYTTRS